jgi:hypothetical protein
MHYRLTPSRCLPPPYYSFPNSSSATTRGVPAPSSAAPPAAQGDLTFAPETTAQSIAHAPTKRRRAKRTEEERIDYLRADPYVAQFEAYRVLCASCDKWIRLRPNSTYCSIPWDAHRKSCLAKKMYVLHLFVDLFTDSTPSSNNKSAYALDQRNALFTKDPDIRKFDPERVLCNRCDQWLSMPPEDHYNAVQKWLNHRAECSKNFGPSSYVLFLLPLCSISSVDSLELLRSIIYHSFVQSFQSIYLSIIASHRFF